MDGERGWRYRSVSELGRILVKDARIYTFIHLYNIRVFATDRL